MNKKVKSEITSLILMMIVNFEIGVLTFDCYFRPISEYDYFWGSVFTIVLIVTVTLTCIQKVHIYHLIDELDDNVVVISK